MNYENILFDLDGTLTDPCTGIVNGIKYSLGKFNISESDEAKLKMFIGPPLNQSFMEYYNFNNDMAKDAVKYYREYYSEKGIYENILYDDIDILLNTITQNGKNCMIATSKPVDFAVKIAQYFKIDKYFTDIAGSNMDGTLSEKDEIIKTVIDKNSLDKTATIMIGDRKHDILGAHKNNIDSAAVMYGYGSKEELEEAEPAYFCDNVLDILRIFNEE